VQDPEDAAAIRGQVERRLAEQVRRLSTIPGIGKRAAEVVCAEIGIDMSRFPTSAHLASWAGMCPGNATDEQ
jgi:transposase